jgi:type II secretory pathway predicted ATPase ExeA
MIDPITALAGIQSAVALIKKVSKTVDDVSSLGPVLGKYFDAKTTATKAAVQAKVSGNKSAMATAIEIEMALDRTVQFEKELQLLFMQVGKIDVWNKIKDRARSMEIEAAHEARKLKELEAKRKRQMQELTEIIVLSTLGFLLVVGTLWGTWEFIQYCFANRCSWK